MADAKNAAQDDIDPRHRLAQRYMQAAHAELDAKEAAQPKTQRRRPAQLAGKPTLADLRPSLSSSTLLHAFLLMFVVTGALLGLTLCYYLLNAVFVAGRVISVPVGIVIFIGLSYTSAFYLGVVESTANGHTEPDSALDGDWRDWFWTMPASWGVLLMSAGLGWLVSRLAPDATWTIIGAAVWLVYPILQLSTLETGSPGQPFSPPVLRSLFRRPMIWMLFFALSFALWRTVVWLSGVTWRDPPFLTMLLMGPIVTLALLTYAWLLGQLARWLTIGGR